jgi:hypothetical protein
MTNTTNPQPTYTASNGIATSPVLGCYSSAKAWADENVVGAYTITERVGRRRQTWNGVAA